MTPLPVELVYHILLISVSGVNVMDVIQLILSLQTCIYIKSIQR
jgi:hypothetical protein